MIFQKIKPYERIILGIETLVSACNFTVPTTNSQDCSNFQVLFDFSKISGHLCGDGSCIPFWKLCNGEFDCPDNSDELSCSKLNDLFYLPTLVVFSWNLYV